MIFLYERPTMMGTFHGVAPEASAPVLISTAKKKRMAHIAARTVTGRMGAPTGGVDRASFNVRKDAWGQEFFAWTQGKR